jgi:hypothetical protein
MRTFPPTTTRSRSDRHCRAAECRQVDADQQADRPGPAADRPEAGITRDSISVDWEWKGRKIKLFDTAGLRRKARVQEKLEKLSVGDALRAIRFAEVVVVVLDAQIPSRSRTCRSPT